MTGKNPGTDVAIDREKKPLILTTKLVIKLGVEGVQMLSPPGTKPLTLKFHELVAISEVGSKQYVDEKQLISQVSTLTGAQAEDLEQFLRVLKNSGRTRRRRNPAPVIDLKQLSIPRANQTASLTGGLISLKLPLTLRMCAGQFQLIDHDGCLSISLSAAELIAVGQFARPIGFAIGLAGQLELLGDYAITENRLSEILSLLENARLLSRIEDVAERKKAVQETLSRSQVLKTNFTNQDAEQDEKEALLQQQTGECRPKVIPVWRDQGIPAALGLVLAYAKAYEGGVLDEFYDFRLSWVWDDDRLENFTAKPAIYLCSNYLWSHKQSIDVSETVKRLSPGSITIHGGPDTPKYEEDARTYFADHRHVDIIIRGEGEASAAEALDKLRSVIGQEKPDLSVLANVEGVSYRIGEEIFVNSDRPRIADLDTIPSPYLMGLFDAYKGVPRLHATLETNRGCPYGCTFCDWGSATTSKIRKFDIDRVFGELKWCSDAKVQSISQADANFGIFERDVSIAEFVAELKTSTGYPETFGGSYAKNSTKYLQKIIKVMAEGGILAQGVLSLQTMDESTLSAIKRSNIKVEKYDALANEMRNANLQLSVELMMGLPGATLESFVEDLQQCIDRDIPARINHTTMLVNSPMNHPEYRAKHQIETGTTPGPGKMPALVSTRTYTREDLQVMMDIRQLYILLDNFGVLRLCSRFMRQQTGMEEMEFYRKLLEGVSGPGKEVQWPLLNTLANWGQHLMAPVYSWALVFDELRLFLVQECDVPDDSALDSILVAQHALLPAHGRTYPFSVEISHDVVAWHSQMLAAKVAGHWRDWQMVVPPLSAFAAGHMDVNDENGWVTDMLGCDLDLSASGVNWDMESGIARARVDQEFHPGDVGAGNHSEEEIVRVVG
jgi:radical SAM superfamily enzyme YgiQ (UPF0313 family)